MAREHVCEASSEPRRGAVKGRRDSRARLGGTTQLADPPTSQQLDTASVELRNTAADGAPEGSKPFSRTTRIVGRVWVAVTVPLVALGGIFVDSERSYLIGWVLLSALYTTPGLVVAWALSRRVQRSERRAFWQWWQAGMLTIYLAGACILGASLLNWAVLRMASGFFVVAATVAFATGLVWLMSTRSGGRAVAVDVIESAMFVIAVVAVGVPVLGEPIASSAGAWFLLPSAFTGVMLLTGLCWLVSMRHRVARAACVVETLGIALMALGLINAACQLAQGLSGFRLPSAPLFVLQATCMGLLLLVPLHRGRDEPRGLDRLPPQAQVRTVPANTILAAVLSAGLFMECFTLRDSVSWGLTFASAVLLVQLVLMAARYQLATNETRRLFAQVESISVERRRLLAEMMQNVEHDRHRVAAQLHEQALSSYVAFRSYVRSGPQHAENGDGTAGSSSLEAVQEGLGGQAEALRRLMLAIKPLESTGAGPNRLAAPIAAYVDNLYGDQPKPVLIIDVDPDLELDWMTEAVVSRILQEALRNVWGHSGATHVSVSVRLEGESPVVRVADDGRGFDRSSLLFESGLSMIESFATMCAGSLGVRSSPGSGTKLTANLGQRFGRRHDGISRAHEPGAQKATATRGEPADVDGHHSAPPHLRLVPASSGQRPDIC